MAKAKPTGAKRRKRLTAEAQQHRDRIRFIRKAVPEATAAREYLRPIAAEWVAAIRVRITVLCREVNHVMHESRPGTVLHGVFDHARLSAIADGLGKADCEAAGLYVAYHDIRIPNLLSMLEWVCREEHPLAEAGAKVGFEEFKDAVLGKKSQTKTT